MNNYNKSWYIVIIVLFVVWFLLVLTTGILNLVLRELKDNRWRESYLKAYYWAEAWQELALLKVKQAWYSYYDKINHDINNKSIILSENPTKINDFKRNKYAFISYDLNSKTDSYSWALLPLWYDIIPLFYLTWSLNTLTEKKVKDLKLLVTSGTPSDLSWNIVSKDSWISWIWNFNKKTIWKWRKSDLSFLEEEIWSFLSNNNSNYIILFNSNSSPNSEIKYNISSSLPFTKPRTEIISSAQIGNYRQNLKTNLDNTEYLNILKYSIYSK